MAESAVPAQLNVVTLGARDLGRLREFYVALGWPLVFEAEDFAAFGLRGAVLSLFPYAKLAADGRADPAAPQPGMRGFTLAIVVDSPEQVDTTIEAVRQAGGRITKEPVEAEEFDGRDAYFADPEDNFWEVVGFRDGGAVLEAVRRATG
jgi:catechol 2,3-dioxygenase-like lactoylglutathione lyase family enzyme